ncbi:GspE/PulE family protein [Undibacterium fentianense]|uniref:Flp pilus assembly complex ATPase component TadA n=1 Tax=Undibacterium fentianense TaxID=2828728 RepID=A0A941IEI5_9BURK|nr:GspE/PulE family protein [Undibacterium fentianense]MBR7799427.1 Flp pilus assembly complex ATPase component TadA [Undibacterium fentianense]
MHEPPIVSAQPSVFIMQIPHHRARPLAHNLNELRHLLDLQTGLSHERLGQYLLNERLITPENLRDALSIVRHSDSKKLGEVLLESNLLTKESLEKALLDQLDIPSLVLDQFEFEAQALILITPEIAQRYQVLPVMLHRESLVICTSHLLPPQAYDFIRFLCQKNLINVIADAKSVQSRIDQCYLQRSEDDGLQLFEETLDLEEDNPESYSDAEFMAKQQPIVKLVESILQQAITRNASDIHIRPEAKHFDLLYRIDGSMLKIKEYPKSLLPAVVGRIKILARLNIAERRLPQDGRITYRLDNNKIDLRISIIPVQFGESIVVRVLNKNQGLRTLDAIGFAPHDEANLHDLLHRSHGIILVTGPTGSGKSTTLYAALLEVAKSNVNIITIEDPIEYELSGTRQIQLIPAIQFSFPQALRHILRHDPDVIMIGEMRDLETCKIAMESALTGHLVFSTLHTNDAASSVIRLMEMGMDPYLIRASVIGILAQRLVRKNCPHCLEIEPVTPLMRAHLRLSNDEVFYRGKGCEHCHFTGFSGRLAIYELMIIDDTIRAEIQSDVSAERLASLALTQGMTSIADNAVLHARLQRTSISEIYRACM